MRKMVTKLVKISLIAIVTVVFVLIIVAVALNQLTNDSPGSPLINPTPTQTSAANPSASPTKTSNPTSTNSAQQTPTPKPTTTGTNPAPTIQPTPTPTSPSTATPTIQPVPTSIAPTPTPPPTPTATPRPPLTVTFDFDTATPTMRPSMNTPFSQTTSGVTAQFSSPTDPAAFSIQSYDTTLYRLSQFTGNYISDNRPTRDTLEVRFNQSITSVTFTFATFEYHGGPNSQPSNITMIAYMDSTTNPVGSTTARGTWPTGGNAFPQGTLTYSSNAPFNYIKIDLPYQSQQGANDYLIDNLIIITS